MTTPYRKKLIEVALPLAAISDACAREKDVHVGLPPNFHTWWSRKPLAAARAVIAASLLDAPEGTDEAAHRSREALLDLVARIADPDVACDPRRAAALAQELRNHVGTMPVFCDPFAGGGSLPLEALRLGLQVVAGDLNPVAALITHGMTDLLPRYSAHVPGSGHKGEQTGFAGGAPYEELLADVRRWAEVVKSRAAKRLEGQFPTAAVAGSSPRIPPVAWIWARTVKCPSPGCGVHTPLVNKFTLSTHVGNAAWADPQLDPQTGRFVFRIRTDDSPPPGTVRRDGARCLGCPSPIPLQHIRDEGKAGRLGFSLMAVVVPVGRRRVYLAPTADHAVTEATLPEVWKPDTLLPDRALGFRVQNYGITRHSDLFTPRQLAVVSTFADEVNRLWADVRAESNDSTYADAVTLLLAFAVDRLAQTNSTLVRWLVRASGTSKGTPAFDRQIVPMTWEFAEGHPFGDSVGSWDAALKNVLGAVKSFPTHGASVDVQLRNAEATVAATSPGVLVSTDPPYFDNIGYSDLSDFFYIWLRRSLRGRFQSFLTTVLVPKELELVASADRFGGDKLAAEEHFNTGLRRVFRNLADRVGNAPATIYYAFKQSETDEGDDGGEARFASTGWEKLLDAVVGSGLFVTGTWPIRTERRARMRALGSNALASSVVLVCRRRSPDAVKITRGDFRRLLRQELPAALDVFRQDNLAPVDLAQASIGPGIEIFSRHSAVLEADGSEMPVRTALQLINEALYEYLSSQEGDSDSDTLFAITWFGSNGWNAGTYDNAETFARTFNVAVAGIAKAGIIYSAGGKVRLLKRAELLADWDPTQDPRLTVWEATQHLIKRLEEQGEAAAAGLLKALGPLAEHARDLAYRLYSTCERKGWAEDARAYNGLVIAWPELEKLAAAVPAPVATSGQLGLGIGGGEKNESNGRGGRGRKRRS